MRIDAEQDRRQHVRDVIRSDEARGQPKPNQRHALTDHHSANLLRPGAERQPHSDLRRAMLHDRGYQAEDADGRKQQRSAREHGSQQHVQSLARDREREHLAHFSHIGYGQPDCTCC